MVDFRLLAGCASVIMNALALIVRGLDGLFPKHRFVHWLSVVVGLAVAIPFAVLFYQVARGKEAALDFALVPFLRDHWIWFSVPGLFSLGYVLYRGVSGFKRSMDMSRGKPAPIAPEAIRPTYRPAEIARPRGERQPKAPPEAIPAGDQLPFANSPRELKEYIQGLTPGKRSKIAPQYVGHSVVWSGYLRHAERPSGGVRKISVSLWGVGRDEFFTAFVADDPEVDDVPDGGNVRIAGEIMSVYDLTLTSARLIP